MKWYRLAAEQGNADAQYKIGDRCFYGNDVPQDHKEAVKWYRLASEQGLSVAQLKLGNCYKEGDGVPQDYAEAYAWFNLAAVRGGDLARWVRDDALQEMTLVQIKEGLRLSREYEEKFMKK